MYGVWLRISHCIVEFKIHISKVFELICVNQYYRQMLYMIKQYGALIFCLFNMKRVYVFQVTHRSETKRYYGSVSINTSIKKHFYLFLQVCLGFMDLYLKQIIGYTFRHHFIFVVNWTDILSLRWKFDGKSKYSLWYICMLVYLNFPET